MSSQHLSRRIQLVLKRVFDITVSFAALLLLSPLIAFIAVVIKLDDGGPVFFIQERVGKGGKPFRAYKFRTMVVGAEKIGLGLEIAKDDQRITRGGRLLRQWTLDELPQLFNVLKAEMSVVGPRPGLPHQAARYTPMQRRRLEMQPGMAGWAWIHGRNRMPWEQRIEMDVWYVDHWSLTLDFHILLRAFIQLLRREGLYGEDGLVHDLEDLFPK
jgi:lipopolysaccharide/colanic/teichoic acid biosynthesis glycosyltransferase